VQPQIESRIKPVLATDGLEFRDLDGNGELAAYEDWRLSESERIDDLLGRMTVAEKVGAMMHSTLPTTGGFGPMATGYDFDALEALLGEKHVTNLLTRLSLPPEDMARESNRVQEIAEATRLGIPLTISTDPRNHFQYVLGASNTGSGVTQWPETLGFAALGDAETVRKFGDIARREHRAMGLHMTLSPQLDLPSEPRWPRQLGTFGSDPNLASTLGGAYVAGFQGGSDGLQANGVATVAKHWVAYGAQPEGYDAHNYYGQTATPGSSFDEHVMAFRGALEARVAGVMPAYPILEGVDFNGTAIGDLPPGYNRVVLRDMLRDAQQFEGIVVTDWGITQDCGPRCRAPDEENPQRPQDIATSWGVGDLSVEERYALAITAGVDQLGGTDDVAPLLAALASGKLSEAQLDESVRRTLMPKFRLGLFENPYVDPGEVGGKVGLEDDHALAARTQREAQVLLQNRDATMPLATGSRVWLFGMNPQAATDAGLTVVDTPAEADFAIIRTEAPAEMLHPYHFFGARQKEGRLDFRPGDPAFDALELASNEVPAVLAIFLDRPAILANVVDKAAVILGNFGASDEAVLDVLLGNATARGRLPFELPRSMEAVEAQHPGRVNDSRDPLFAAGFSALPE
jgi:beta-glucosidase